LSEEVEKTTSSEEAVQELIDSAEILKQLHDEILAQIEKFDELTEKISSMKGPGN
jgi:prefoldin subunit 5